MALSFTKKNSGSAQANANTGQKAASADSGQAKKSGGTSWMLRGKQAHQAMQQEEARAEMARQNNGMFSFWMPEGSEKRITFLDGSLDEDGVLDVLAFYQHVVKQNGRIQTFVCTAEADTSQPCPICEQGEKAKLVHVFTVIDHTPHTIQKGPNSGKVIEDTRKLFYAKRTTMQVLQKMAAKRGGLTGCVFDVSRTGDKSPAVGDHFDFVHKFETQDEIAEAVGKNSEDIQPADYENEVSYISPEELIKLGYGSGLKGVSGASSTSNLKSQI